MRNTTDDLKTSTKPAMSIDDSLIPTLPVSVLQDLAAYHAADCSCAYCQEIRQRLFTGKK